MKYQDLKNGRFYWEDCFDAMKEIPDGVVDMILCDLPYGTTACAWDAILPFDRLWAEYRRLIRGNGAIVLTASQPFTTALIGSNIKEFRYEWIWEKDGGSNFATVKYQPMKEHENVCVFYRNMPTYNAQKQERIGSRKGRVTTTTDSGRRDSVYGTQSGGGIFVVPELRSPRSIQRFNRERGLHPTQKPVALFEYLIKTYTDEGQLVVDNCAGSGTTAIAAINTNRRWVCIEKDEEYANKAIERIANHAPAKVTSSDRQPAIECDQAISAHSKG